MTCRIARAGHRAGCMLALALALSPSTSSAQQATPGQLPPDPPQRPVGALFDGSRRPQRDILSLTTEMYGGYDQELQGPPGGAPFGIVRTGSFAGLDGGLAFTPTQNPTVDFNARAFTSVRYYTNPSELVLANTNADAAASFAMGRRTTLQTRGGVMYAPYYDFPMVEEIPLPGVITPVPIRGRDVAVSNRRVGTYDGAADIAYSVTQGVGIGLGYGVRRTDLVEEERSAIDTTATAQVNFRLNRRTSSRVALVHREGEHEAGGVSPQSVRVDDIEISVDRDWVRSPTRQTHFTFMGGPSRVEQGGRRLMRAIGGAAVTHVFARSWDIRATYRRGVTFLDGVPDPVLSNAATVNLGGMLTTRLELSAGVAVTLGEVGFSTVEASTYDTYIGSVRGRFGLTRTLALYGEYVYQQHKYRDLTADVLPAQDRSGVRGGLTWYLPLMQESLRQERPVRRGRERP